MIEEITQELWEASEKKRVCRIQMSGEPLNRVIHPYGVCKTSANKIVLVCWQSLGFTNTKGQPGYRNLLLTELESVEVLETHFQKRADFNPQDSQYKDWVFHI
ncbi:MAG TPA: hypothetical protein VFU05_05435 [Cyclobacteriaceae bacterium]|nr:hypothetical protein [Cyclobacteriaceae bacterium]